MSNPTARPATAGPPTKHQLALMIWLRRLPDADRPQLRPRRLAAHPQPRRAHLRARHRGGADRHLRLMPQLHRLRVRLLTRIAG